MYHQLQVVWYNYTSCSLYTLVDSIMPIQYPLVITALIQLKMYAYSTVSVYNTEAYKQCCTIAIIYLVCAQRAWSVLCRHKCVHMTRSITEIGLVSQCH